MQTVKGMAAYFANMAAERRLAHPKEATAKGTQQEESEQNKSEQKESEQKTK